MTNKSFSFVLATRNDNFEGNPLERLKTSLKHNYDLLKKYNIDFEILICDWGSNINEKIQDNLDLDIEAKIYYVPKEVCEKFDTPFSEVHALNLLFRKASKHFVARLDQDTMIGERFVKWISEVVEIEDILHWSVRRDMQNSEITMSDESTVPWDNSWNDGINSYCSFFGAVGILIYPTIKMQQIRGYNEQNIYRNHMEHELLKRLVSNDDGKYNEIGRTLDRPFYHIFHSRTDGAKRKQNTSFDNTIENDENWGLLQEEDKIKEFFYRG